MKTYKDVNGQTYKIEVRYDLGGANYYSGGTTKRGYYIIVTPVKIEQHDGYQSESFMLFSGIKKLLAEVSRKSTKALINAESMATEELINDLIDYCESKKERA